MIRGCLRQSDAVFVGAWLPVRLVSALDQAVAAMDSDRSKMLRLALEQQVSNFKKS